MGTTRKPHIFIFTTAYHPLIGGAELAIEEIAKRLRGEFEFTIITWRARRDLARLERCPEGMVVRVGFGGPIGKILLPFIGTLRTLALMRRAQPALFWPVMVTFASGIPYIINIIRFWDPVPVMLTLQEGDSERHIARARFGLVGLSWRLALARADFLTAISSYLAGLAERYGYAGRREVIPNGVSAERFHPARPGDREWVRVELGVRPDETLIVSVSRLVAKNGLDVLVRAMAILLKRTPAKLIVIGDGEERANLAALTRDLGLGDAVTFPGSMPNADIGRYLSAADIFCRPSRSEGLGTAFLEAMAAGLPLVATSVGGIADFLKNGENGLVCRMDDPHDVAAKIASLIADPALAKRLGGEGRKIVLAGYSWDVIAKRFGDLFRHLAASRPLRLLIAAPMLPPAIGGPATYATALAESLSALGVVPIVLAYGDQTKVPKTMSAELVSHRIPFGLRQLVYFWRALRLAGRCNAVLALDPAGVGVPAAIAALFWRRSLLLRLEGDTAWERYVERTGRERTLADFTRALPHDLSRKERMLRAATRFTARRAARVVFSSRWRAEIFGRDCPLAPGRSVIIGPPWPRTSAGVKEREQTLLFAGRFVRVKNLRRLAEAFAASCPPPWRLELVGDGPERSSLERLIGELGLSDRIRFMPLLSPQELRRRIAAVHAFLLPSLSDVSPNVIRDCLALGTPFLLTRESGFAETLAEVGMFVDPLDTGDIAAKLRSLLDPYEYASRLARLAAFGPVRSWGQVADEWIALVRSCL